MFHILDTLSFDNIKNILNEIDNFQDKKMKALINEYFNKQMIEQDKIIALFHYKKKDKITILIKEDKNWILPKKDTSISKLTQKMLNKWRIDWKLNINEDIIGFMNQKNSSREDIIFRTKSNIRGKTKGKGGRSCEKANKSTMKSKITKLYQKTNPGFKDKNLTIINGKIPSSLMYCIMLELILRHFDEEKIKGPDEIQKKWFFSPLFSELWGVDYLPETSKTSNQKNFIKKIE